MGAEYCDVIVEATNRKELEKCFDEIIKNCEYDYGHRGYTGTFAEKDSVSVVESETASAWTEEEARKHCEDNNNKWGPASAYWLGGNRWYIGGLCSS